MSRSTPGPRSQCVGSHRATRASTEMPWSWSSLVIAIAVISLLALAMCICTSGAQSMSPSGGVRACFQRWANTTRP